MASGIFLAGFRGTLLEQTAAMVAAMTGWRIELARPGAPPTGHLQEVVCLGWQSLFEGQGRGLRVLLTASWSTRIRRIAAEQGLSETEAAGIAAAEQREVDDQARRAGWARAEDLERFDLVVNTERLSPQAAANLIVAAAESRSALPRLAGGEVAQDTGSDGAPGRVTHASSCVAARDDATVMALHAAPPERGGGTTVVLNEAGAPQPIHHPTPPGGRVVFAHPSEEEFARVLDFYRVKWQYEPTTFPLEWDENGRVTSAFTPDFYLPEWDLYVELTTMKQGLVNRKNRKIRRLKELYPGINIKVFYGRDFERLLRKFGA